MFRCLDHAGTSADNKPVLVGLAKVLVQLVKASRLENRACVFRNPLPDLRTFEEKEKSRMSDLPPVSSRVTDWEMIRHLLPEMSKSVIMRFLKMANPLAREGSRVWIRGMQRTMDMGNLARLWAAPADDGVLWIGFR